MGEGGHLTEDDDKGTRREKFPHTLIVMSISDIQGKRDTSNVVSVAFCQLNLFSKSVRNSTGNLEPSECKMYFSVC